MLFEFIIIFLEYYVDPGVGFSAPGFHVTNLIHCLV